jgi:hypothetical protein
VDGGEATVGDEDLPVHRQDVGVAASDPGHLRAVF